jgi:RNA-binding protein YhbY
MVRPMKRLQLGKNGLSPEFINQVKSIFEDSKETMVKVSILKSACRDKKEAEKIAQDLVASLGKNYDYKLIGYVMTVKKFRKAQR